MLTFITLLMGKITRSEIVTVLSLGVFSVVAGGVVFAAVEHRNVWLGLYWAVTTATTVGYGDVTPETTAGHIVAVVVMLTAIPLLGAAFALFAATAAATQLRKYISVEHHLPPGKYVVLLGMHPTVPLVAKQLKEAGYVVVIAAPVETAVLPHHVYHIQGDPTDEETVRKTKPWDAEAVLLIAPEDGDMLVSAVVLRHVAPDVPVVAVSQSTMVAHALNDLGINQSISTEQLLGHALAKSLETPHAAQVLLQLIDNEKYKMVEVPVAGEQIGTSLHSLRQENQGLLLGVVHEGEVMLGVTENPVLEEGDYLLRVVLEK